MAENGKGFASSSTLNPSPFTCFMVGTTNRLRKGHSICRRRRDI